MANELPHSYNDSQSSDIGIQLVEYAIYEKVLRDIRPKKIFGQLADTRSMPKNHGKTIKQYCWVSLLSDENLTNQGIDSDGDQKTYKFTIIVNDALYEQQFCVGYGTTAQAALNRAMRKAEDYFKLIGVFDTDYATTVTNLTAAGWTIADDTLGRVAEWAYGNLYGSSKDVSFIKASLPMIGEHGGRKNRVGFQRKYIEGTIENFGIFFEYTEDSLQFDSQTELLSMMIGELIEGANQVVEDMLQADLLNNAGVNMYGGNAFSTATLDETCVLDYSLLMQLDKILDDSYCPKDTKVLTGSTNTDTRTIGAARYCYVGSALRLALNSVLDMHGRPAFIPVHQYEASGKTVAGEIGAIGHFRFIEAQKMLYWEGAGAIVTDDKFYNSYVNGNSHYDVFPLLVVGSNCFTTIGFNHSGNDKKFKTLHKKPGIDMMNRDEPYGKMGIYSVQWWYGFMAIRPEWLAVVKVTAPMSL